MVVLGVCECFIVAPTSSPEPCVNVYVWPRRHRQDRVCECLSMAPTLVLIFDVKQRWTWLHDVR